MATPLAALPASLGATRVRASALSLRRASPRVNTFRRVVSARPVLQLSNRRALVVAAAAPEAATVLPEIVASFNLATFTPQVFWLAMIFAPRHPVTRAVMGSWLPIFWATGVHFFVDYVGFNQPGALEEAAKFGQVFDPSISTWSWADGSRRRPPHGFQSMLETPTSSPRSGRTCSRGISSSDDGCGSTPWRATSLSSARVCSPPTSRDLQDCCSTFSSVCSAARDSRRREPQLERDRRGLESEF